MATTMSFANDNDVASLNVLLLSLLTPDSNKIHEAQNQLKPVLKQAGCIGALAILARSATDTGVRQLAAVVLRQRVLKLWIRVPIAHRKEIKDMLLESIAAEPVALVGHSVSRVVAAIARHEMRSGEWPELPRFVFECCGSGEAVHRRSGTFLLSTIAETVGDQLREHYQFIFSLLERLLRSVIAEENGACSAEVALNVLSTLSSVLPYIDGKNEIALLRGVLPSVVEVVRHLLKGDQEQAARAMEFFDELVESKVGVPNKDIQALIRFTLEVIICTEHDNSVRCKALSFLMWVAMHQRKAYVGAKGDDSFLRMTIDVICGQVICEPSPIIEGYNSAHNQGNDDDDEDNDETSDIWVPAHYSSQLLDTFALHLPAAKVVPLVLAHVERLMMSAQPLQRRAAMTCIMVICEGCSGFLTPLINQLLTVVFAGLDDSDVDVRGSAALALAELSEQIQPEISELHETVFPRLFQSLRDSSPAVAARACRGLAEFLDHIESPEVISPHLADIMTILGSLVQSSNTEASECALHAVSAMAAASGVGFAPYFQHTFDLMHRVMLTSDDSTLGLRIHATDTIGTLATGVGRELFFPYAERVITAAAGGFASTDDPELRQVTYGLFASLTSILGDSMLPFLDIVLPNIIQAACTSYGAEAIRSSDCDAATALLCSVDDDENENADNSDLGIDGYSVGDALVAEMETAINVLGSLVRQLISPKTATETSCLTEQVVSVVQCLIDRTLENLMALTGYKASSGVRKAAITALCDYVHCSVLIFPTVEPLPSLIGNGTITKVPGGGKGGMTWLAGVPAPIKLSNMAMKLIDTIMPRFCIIVQEEEDRSVVLALLDAVNDLLRDVGPCAVEPVLESWVMCLSDILRREVSCQQRDDDCEDEDNKDSDEAVCDDDELEHSQAEFDELLVYSGCVGVSTLAKVTGSYFVESPLFESFSPLVLDVAGDGSDPSAVDMVVSTFAEIAAFVGLSSTAKIAATVMPIFSQALIHPGADIRSDAIFGVGAMCAGEGVEGAHCDAVAAAYSQVVAFIGGVISRCSNVTGDAAREVDNATGALARMMVARSDLIPSIESCLDNLLAALPLRLDLDETAPVIDALCVLLQEKTTQQLLFARLSVVLDRIAKIVIKQQEDVGIMRQCIALVGNLTLTFGTEIATAAQNIRDPKLLEALSLLTNN